VAVNSVLAGARMTGSSSVYSILAGVRMVSPTSGLYSVLAGARMVGSQPVAVDAGEPETLDPFQPGSLSAVVPTGTPAGSWTWEFVSSSNPHVTAVAITQAGATATYATPPTLDGAALIFRARYQMSGQPDSTGTVSHTIRPHGLWKLTPSGLYSPIQLTLPVPFVATSSGFGTGVFGTGIFGTGPIGFGDGSSTRVDPVGVTDAVTAILDRSALVADNVGVTDGSQLDQTQTLGDAAGVTDSAVTSLNSGGGLGLAPLGTSPLGL
jgi:hypothetical protein